MRRALNLAFNFEMTNKNLLNNEYTRVASYFDNSEFAAKGLPEGRELALLGEVRGEIPPEVFTTEWKNPVNDTPEQVRANLGQAAKLLGEAGWVAKGGVLANAAGEPLAVEILLAQPDLERIVLPWKVTLERLGVKAQIRLVDSAQYIRRRESFDFDVIVTSYQQSQSPGNEQREFWSSEAAAREGSRNTTGIKNPAIDKLVERVVFATDRAELGAATRALDRVLLWNHYVVPLYYAPFERVATWDLFSRPAKLPSQAVSFLTVWWYDAEKAKKLEEARAKR